MADKLKCLALINEPPWYIRKHPCNRGASMYEGFALCGVHIRVLKRWAATRTRVQLVHMVEFHWSITLKTQTEKVKPSLANEVSP